MKSWLLLLGGSPFSEKRPEGGGWTSREKRAKRGSWTGRHLAKSPLLPSLPPVLPSLLASALAGAASGVAGVVLVERVERTRTPKLSLGYLGEKARRERFNVGPADTLYSSAFHCHVCSTPGGGHIAKQSVATVTARSTNLNTLFTSLCSEYSLSSSSSSL